jgi:hypothetical protein
MQSPAAPFQGPAASRGFSAPLSAPTPVTPSAAPPPPVGSPLPWPPPPGAASPAPGQPTAPQAPLSDTMERMLRPQGLFQNRPIAPAEWQQPQPPLPPQPPQPPAPGAYPPGGQFQGSPYPPQPGAPYPPGGQYPPTGAFQQAAPPPWGPAPTGVMPPAEGQTPPVGPGQPAVGYPPGGQYPQGGAYPGPYPNGQFPGGPYGQDQLPTGQFGPGVQYGPGGMPLGNGPLADGAPSGPGLLGKLPFKRPKGPLVPVAVAAGVVIVVAVALTLSAQGGSSSNTTGTPAGAAPTATSSTGTAALTRQQAATALSGLLQQSGGDRQDVGGAVVDVENCGKRLAQDTQVFNKAAGNRRALLSKLAQLPDRSALSPAMVSDLTNAWQASATVDADLAKWAHDQAGHCKKGNTKDANYKATIPFDNQATNAKNAFVQLWNPLAKQDSLPTRQSGEL